MITASSAVERGLANGTLARCLASDFVTAYSPVMSRNRPDLAGLGRLCPEVQPGKNNWHPMLFDTGTSNYVVPRHNPLSAIQRQLAKAQPPNLWVRL